MFNVKNSLSQTPSFSTLLTAQQKENYLREGYIVLPNFISDDLCTLLIDRAKHLINNLDSEALKHVFFNRDERHLEEEYFLESGDKIHFFLEEGSVDALGNLTKDKLLSINKIGHALHELDPIFYCFSRLHKIAVLMSDLGMTDPLLVQSMYICKQPWIGSEVSCHQDSTYLFVKDEPITGLWFALQEATIYNGCLWAIPGGHRTALKSRMIRDKDNRITTVTYDNTPWALEKMIPLEVPRGSLIVLHGLLPHMSKENKSALSRHAYTLHVMSKHHEYAADNWLKRKKESPFKGFL